jgi:hypothetical protein
MVAIYSDPAAELEGDQSERAILKPHQQAELWHQIVSTIENEQELLLARASLIYALSPRAIYALHPDLFADITAVYRTKHNLFKRLQHNQAIERLCTTGTLAPNEDT